MVRPRKPEICPIAENAEKYQKTEVMPETQQRGGKYLSGHLDIPGD
jgi:hypothetical protein